MMSVSEILQRLERLEEHCKIEATKVELLCSMHHGVLPGDHLHLGPSPATRLGEAGVRSEAEPWETYNPLPASLHSGQIPATAPAARHLYDIGHKIAPFVMFESGPDGCILEMKFKSLDKGYDFYTSLVKFFTTAPAASGTTEPVAWMCEWTDHTSLYDSQTQAEIDSGGEIVPQPLYRAPPPRVIDTLTLQRDAAIRSREDAARNRDRLHGELGECRQKLAAAETESRERQQAMEAVSSDAYDVSAARIERDAAIQRAEAADLFHESQKDMMTHYVSRIEALNLRCELRDLAVKKSEARVAELEGERDNRATIDEVAHQRDTLQARVNRLEKQLESVACRAATAETALEAAPPARGWLTPEERKALESARLHLSNFDGFDEATERECKWASDVCGRLLARSTPPEVVLPGTQVRYHSLSVEEQRDAQWLAALAAAGVTVKEVGRE